GPALYMGGSFTSIGGQPVSRFAKWNGSAWSQVGGGTSDWILSMQVFNDGSGPALFISGGFTIAGSTQVNRVAKWNGSQFSALANGFTRTVYSLAVFDDGFTGPQLHAAGGQNSGPFGQSSGFVYRWDGASWISLSDNDMDLPVFALGLYNDGRSALFAGGQ